MEEKEIKKQLDEIIYKLYDLKLQNLKYEMEKERKLIKWGNIKK